MRVHRLRDRAWFANQFLENPDWRLTILDIEGGAVQLLAPTAGSSPRRATAVDRGTRLALGWTLPPDAARTCMRRVEAR